MNILANSLQGGRFARPKSDKEGYPPTTVNLVSAGSSLPKPPNGEETPARRELRQPIGKFVVTIAHHPANKRPPLHWRRCRPPRQAGIANPTKKFCQKAPLSPPLLRWTPRPRVSAIRTQPDFIPTFPFLQREVQLLIF